MQFFTLRTLATLFLCAAMLPALSLPASAAPVEHSADSAPAGNPLSIKLNEQGVAAVKANDFSGAEALFRQSLSADTKNLTAVFNLAGMYINNKKQQEAIVLLDDYIKQYSKDAGLFARRGDAYFTLKKIDQAAKDYEMALSLDPKSPGVAAKLGTIYSLQNKLDAAEKNYLAAVEQDPKNGQLLANLSAIFLTNKKPDKAVSTAKRALQVNPSPAVYVTLGTAYEVMKDYKNSLIAFQRAADLGDNRPELRTKIDELKKLNS